VQSRLDRGERDRHCRNVAKKRLARFIFFALRWKQQVDGQTVTRDREKWCPSGTMVVSMNVIDI
jgi:hypothetical protein